MLLHHNGASINGCPLSEAIALIGRSIIWTLEGRLNANADANACLAAPLGLANRAW